MTEEIVVPTGHCMKCKEKREMKDTEEVEMKNGRKAMKGLCSVCGTKMFKILGNKKQSCPKKENALSISRAFFCFSGVIM